MNGKQETVIVMLDDVKENLYELASVVDELGYEARPVLTVGQARKALSMGDVTLLLLDIAMPEMSGFEFLRRMRTMKEWKEIPVVFVSAYMDVDTKTTAFALGAQDYIVRPFDRKECGCRIRQAVRQAELMKQMQIQKEDMQRMLTFQGEQMQKARRQVAEAVISMVEDEEPLQGHFQRIRESVVHFAKGLSVVPEYEEQISGLLIELLEVAAPLYILGTTRHGMLRLQKLQEQELENDYISMGVEIAVGVAESQKRKNKSLVSEMVSLVVSYDTREGTVEERMQSVVEEKVRYQDSFLLHAFQIIQRPYYLDKEGDYGVSY